MYNITRYLWKNNYKVENQRSLAKKIGMNECHLSRILNRHQHCPTRTAIAITNAIDINGKIEDYFERI